MYFIMKKEVSKVVFRDWYRNLPLADKREFRDTFLNESKMSFPLFYIRVREGNWRHLEKMLLCKMMNMKESSVDFD